MAAAVSSRNGSGSDGFDYDLVIIGAGVGGHGAALHAVEKVACSVFCFLLRDHLDLCLRIIIMRTGSCFWLKKLEIFPVNTSSWKMYFFVAYDKFKYSSN